MKKYLETFFVGMTLSSAAWCQSSVTLYGMVDAGIGYVNNQGGSSAVQMTSRNASFWGLKGTEDLGNKISAIFWLETGFSSANGALLNGNVFFGRQAQVGLSSPWGSLTLGNQYDPVVDGLQKYSSSATFAGNLGAESADVNNIWADFHINNSVKYVSPTMRGFSYEMLYSFGGVAGSMSTKRIYSGGASYSAGAFSIGAAYLNINNPITAVYQGTSAPANTQTLGSPFSSPIYSGYASAQNLQIAGIGASYVLGHVTINAIASNSRFRDIIPTPGKNQRTSAHFNNFELNQTWYVLPELALSTGVIYTVASGANYEQAVAGINYLLSKSTGLYLLGAWMRANGVDSSGKAAVADITNVAASTTRNQIAFRTGIRIRF
jgi:predicted porin